MAINELLGVLILGLAWGPAYSEQAQVNPVSITAAIVVGSAVELLPGKSSNFTADIPIKNGSQDFESLNFKASYTDSRLVLTVRQETGKKKTSKDFTLDLPLKPEKLQLGFTALSNPLPQEFIQQILAGNPLASKGEPLSRQLAADLKTLGDSTGNPSLVELIQVNDKAVSENGGVLALSASTDSWASVSVAAQSFSVKRTGHGASGSLSVTALPAYPAPVQAPAPPTKKTEISLRVQFYVKTAEAASSDGSSGFPQIIRFLDEQTYTFTIEPPPPAPANNP